MERIIVTQIYYCGGYKNIDPDKPPVSTKMLDVFLLYNNAPYNIVKQSGGYYKITKNGTLIPVARTLYELSLKQFLEISLNENYS